MFARYNRLIKITAAGDAFGEYQTEDMTIICPEVGGERFVRIAAQRYPILGFIASVGWQGRHSSL